MPTRKLVIFPCNGNAIEALDCVSSDAYEFVGFIDDAAARYSYNYPLHKRDILVRFPELYLLAVPGSPTTYQKRDALIDSLCFDRFISVVHPAANLGRSVIIGRNCVVMAGVVLTSNVQIGDHVCILPNTAVHHDTVIGSYTLIGSNVAVAGGVTIGKKCYIGSGSNIKNGLTVNDGALVGLGSNVLSDVVAQDKIAGNPARSLEALTHL